MKKFVFLKTICNFAVQRVCLASVNNCDKDTKSFEIMEKMFTKNDVLTIAAAAVTMALQQLGITAGEMSQTQAKATYGSEFVRLLAAGKIRPARVGRGARGTRYYKVTEILAARAAEQAKAEIL